MSKSDFDIPKGLSRKGRKAAALLKKLAKKHFGEKTSGGGCRAFYTPQEWKDRGERYGTDSLLVVVHDGGDMAPMLNMDYCCYDLHDEVWKALQEIGVYAECCTGWDTAIYEG